MNEDDRKSAKQLIFKKLHNSSVTHIMSPSSSTQSTPTSTDPLHRLAILCGETEAFSTSATLKQPKTLDEELSAYIAAARPLDVKNFKEFWMSYEKALPRLAQLVKRTHIIPATSVASESLFSIASFLNRKQRSALSSRTLRYLLVLKDRHQLEKLNQTVEQS